MLPELNLKNLGNEIYWTADKEKMTAPTQLEYEAIIRLQRKMHHMRYKQYLKAINLRYKWNKYDGLKTHTEYNGKKYYISTVNLPYSVGYDEWGVKEVRKMLKRCGQYEYETAIFEEGSGIDVGGGRYETRDQAIIGHADAVKNIGEWIYE